MIGLELKEKILKEFLNEKNPYEVFKINFFLSFILLIFFIPYLV